MSPGWWMMLSLSFHIQFVTFSVCFIIMCCIAEILNLTDLPEPTKRDGLVAWYPWTINNKYYTADVNLCVVPSTFQMSSEIAQSMQAFIAYFDSSEVRQWLPGCCLWAVYYCCRVSWDRSWDQDQSRVLHHWLFTCVVCRRVAWKSWIHGYQWWKIFLQRCSFWCATGSVKTVSCVAQHEMKDIT